MVSGHLFGVSLSDLTGVPTPPTSFLEPCLCFVIGFRVSKTASDRFRDEILASAVVEWLVSKRFWDARRQSLINLCEVCINLVTKQKLTRYSVNWRRAKGRAS